MIHDQINNWRLYFKAPIFENIFSELAQLNIYTPDGVYKNHSDYYFKVMSYETQSAPRIIESHIKEVDIQILFSGKEKIKLYDKNSVQIEKSYDEASDCQFYQETSSPTSDINLIPGFMAVFFPQDIHHPQFSVDGQINTLKKIVIKVNAKLFTS
ncbi:MAG: DUF386 domain-containing protein [Ferruginibacter sp.]|nr:DUF386 domain-containing protein [Ferruginibacter sp.]